MWEGDRGGDWNGGHDDSDEYVNLSVKRYIHFFTHFLEEIINFVQIKYKRLREEPLPQHSVFIKDVWRIKLETKKLTN